MSETMAFRTELKQLLQLIIHSLYSHKDIFLRELISNASDAIDRVRFEALTNVELLEGNADWKIKLVPDEKAGTLTISDNGVGMSRQTIVDQLGTIARSGTREFLDNLKAADAKDRPELIGKFGVGFYASFMVADKVTVISRMAGSADDAVQWESAGEGEFTLTPCSKPTRGTDVILHLRGDSREFLDPNRLHAIVKKYSDFVEHPIVLEVESGGKPVEDTLNARTAIWLRGKNEITDAEYQTFYTHLSHDSDPPLKTIHFRAEGQIEFKAILFIPAKRPFDLAWGDSQKGLHLYIQRVFILDDCETLLPRYLRFLRGVVDSPDLPLNVSREILQESAPLEMIKASLTSKVLAALEEVKRQDFDKYVGFYNELGPFLKDGAYRDFKNRDQLADLLLFESTRTEAGKVTTLADYVDRMAGAQAEIYFLAGDAREVLDQSPLLEGFKAKGWEVLLLTDPGDELLLDSLRQYKGKTLKAVDKAQADADGIAAETKERYRDLLEFFKKTVSEIADARLTTRLKESAVCLVSEEHGLSANMERFMQRMGRNHGAPESKRILEVNPDHPLIQVLAELLAKDRADVRLSRGARLLYDQAVILEGTRIKDPLAFAARMNALLLSDVASEVRA